MTRALGCTTIPAALYVGGNLNTFLFKVDAQRFTNVIGGERLFFTLNRIVLCQCVKRFTRFLRQPEIEFIFAHNTPLDNV